MLSYEAFRRSAHSLYRILKSPITSPKIVVWPAVETAEQLGDLLPRVRFHFHRGEEIVIPIASPAVQHNARIPHYLVDFPEHCRIRYVTDPRHHNALALALRNRGVLLLDDRPLAGKLRYFPNVAPVNSEQTEMETTWITKFFQHELKAAGNRSRDRFLSWKESLPPRDRVYLLCTGPSLARFPEFDFSDGYVIGCNSVVSNPELLRHARPHLITAVDPIFHFGPSVYAQKFRDDLAAAAAEYSFFFLTIDIYHYLLEHHIKLPSERLAIVPREYKGAIARLQDTWRVPQTSNVLTTAMLPAAFTLAKEIYIIGADGREPNETYFWKHDPATQLVDKMQAIQQAHPAFFNKRNYRDYYEEHCRTLERQIAHIERCGGAVYSLTPSHIPALKSRPAPVTRDRATAR